MTLIRLCLDDQFLVDDLKFLIEFLAEDADDGIFQKPEHGDTLLLTQDSRGFANTPAMIIQCLPLS